MRWPETDGKAVCPHCIDDEAYKITTRRKFKCTACAHQFSVTSGTIFASRKLREAIAQEVPLAKFSTVTLRLMAHILAVTFARIT